jgi:hypothetical protein
VFHIELRQFPHNFCRFNLTERQLRANVLDAWARGERVELGERRWEPDQASLTVLAGPRLQTQDLSMGRGWASAQRQGSDVTERMLEAVRAEQARGPGAGGDAARPGGGVAMPAGGAVAAGGGAQTDAASSQGGVAAAQSAAGRVAAAAGLDAIAAQLGERLGEEPAPLMRAWQLALERHPDRTPSECLALAEELVRR